MKPTIPDVETIARQIHQCERMGMGNAMLIFMEDGNVSDKHIHFCLGVALEENCAGKILLCKLLLLMSRTQRKKLYARLNATTPKESDPQ